MIFAFQKNEIQFGKTLNKPYALIFILFSILLFILSNILVIKNNSSFPIGIVDYSNSNSQFSFNSSNLSTITSNNYLLIPSTFFVIIVFISLFYLGVFTVYQPKPLREIVTSNTLKIIFSKEADSTDIAMINLSGCSFGITWNTLNGQYQNWKINITINIKETETMDKFIQLAKFLLMENDPVDSSRFTKVIFVKDWPRQEYLLSYWLLGLNLNLSENSN